MHRYFWPVLLLLSLAGAQPPAPTLSTSDRIALGQLERQKQEINQQELTILREWQAAHPGWRVDQNTFAVEADPKPEAPKETKKP